MKKRTNQIIEWNEAKASRKPGAWSRKLLVILMASIGLFVRCAPVAYELQSARTAGKDQLEITPSYTQVLDLETKTSPEKGAVSTPASARALGIQAAYGLSEKCDLRFRSVHFYSPVSHKTVFSAGIKVSLLKERMAAYFPIWFVDFRPAQFQPTLLVSFPLVKNKVELNPSGKVLLTLAGVNPMTGLLVAANLGFAVSTNLSRWELRPEYSLIHQRGKAWAGSISIGLTFKLNGLRRHKQ